MKIKKVILSILTVLAIAFLTLSLIGSFTQPQIQGKLELYQTNLLLHAAEWQPSQEENTSTIQAKNTLIGNEPFEAALNQYQTAQKSTKTNLDRAIAAAKEQARKALNQAYTIAEENPITGVPAEKPEVENYQLSSTIVKLETFFNEIDLRIGIIQAKVDKKDAALETWEDLIKGDYPPRKSLETLATARVLISLWGDRSSDLPPDAEGLITQNLDGWFRYQALSKLYELQGETAKLAQLQATEQERAETAFYKLAIVGAVPGIGLIIGVGLLVFLGIQLLMAGKSSLLMQNTDATWEVTWGGEEIIQVFVVGFFLIGQIVLPLAIEILKTATNFQTTNLGVRFQAGYVLVSYLLLALGGISVLYLSLKPYLPLPKDWFKIDWRGGWFLWGFGGYLTAVPLVILVSLINQQIWQGKGGSNPILELALQGQDWVALTLFFVTASIAAPIFEEIMFRGFLLPSLTKYLPMWGAILASSLLFAVAHLNISEVLPLAILGTVLGVVYTRSRNLLSSILLHSLWNGGTLLSLFLLGSGVG